ncbi:zinc carboxypeptidase [Leptobacterium flavescens]|uniref:Zinc carboxypeptidase n=1 Tax=Leptobacterium flavescens TaxID=472055 RepID=A0A6P0UGV7_9FLAO|nr:M14 family metallopeptidase [Leptobacterium flavescens]NER12247.1 zinc carboxypeptidase [Leptobacterium flavescens]
MRFKFTIALLFFTVLVTAQQIKSPSEFLGYELGTRFTRHHQVVDYYEYLAGAAASMMKLESYGKTNEQRRLMVAFVSSEENMQKLEEIRAAHFNSAKGEGNPSVAVVWLSYNVHGNESVSTEASMQTIYELLTKKKDWLKNTVVIIDPCINPDGRDRYVNWYNQFVNDAHNVDPNSKEHHEGWLSGRSNHYMFDLNRDWAWATQVESQQRLKVFNKWLPHIHVDFHEQGVDDPYYFAPAAEPFHEVITDWQRNFQVTIGKNHAKYFDANGWFYFTKEVFDLLYPSYGDTYPTYNGGIGMTYEQGGSGRAGLGIITRNGDTLTLKDRIAHHHTTGLSTVEISSLNAQKLNDEFKKFYNNKNFKYKSYILKGDKDKLKALTDLLDRHEIKYGYAGNTTVRGYDYDSGKAGSMRTSSSDLVVSTNQMKATLVKVLFEPKTKLSDSLTYDITAWSLPYAYGLKTIASENTVSATPSVSDNLEYAQPTNTDSYGYVTNWNSMKDARFLAELLKNKIRVRYNEEAFTVNNKAYGRGSLIITKADNKHVKNFRSQLLKIASNHKKSLENVDSGFVESGKDFGSDSVKMIPDLKVAVLSGGPTSTLSFGEIWHFFEKQLGYPVSVLNEDYFGRVNLSDYDVLILPNGFYGSFLNDNRMKSLKAWVRAGGKLIAIGNSVSGLKGDKGFGIKSKKAEKDSTNHLLSYRAGQREQVKNFITGAIFKTKVDTTHPLAFGYDDTYFSLKLSSSTYDFLESGNVVYIEESEGKPVSGFAGSNALKQTSKSLIFGSQDYGRGAVIYMVDNPLFRGFWENGKLFFANAVFMVNN